MKAIAIARSYLEEDNLDLTIQPSFVKLMLQEDERTAIKLRVTVEKLVMTSDNTEETENAEESEPIDDTTEVDS